MPNTQIRTFSRLTLRPILVGAAPTSAVTVAPTIRDGGGVSAMLMPSTAPGPTAVGICKTNEDCKKSAREQGKEFCVWHLIDL